MKSKYLLVLALSLAFVFTLACSTSSNAMITKQGIHPECIKYLQVWAVDSSDNPRGQIPSCPQHIYATLGGDLSLKWEIWSYHANSDYDYVITYVDPNNTETQVSAGSTHTRVTPVDPNATPPYYSMLSRGFNHTCSYANVNNCLEVNCGYFKFTFTCQCQQCQRCGQSELFIVNVVFNPGMARIISVDAYDYLDPQNPTLITNQAIANEQPFSVCISYVAGEWISNRTTYYTVTILDSVGAEYKITGDLVQQDGLYEVLGKIEKIINNGSCNINGSVYDDLGASHDLCSFQIAP